MTKVVVVGDGPGGLSAALFLAKKGMTVTVFGNKSLPPAAAQMCTRLAAFYEALAGRPAFQSRSLKELRTKHLGHDLPDLAKLAPHVPAWMTAWVMSLIVTDPEARPRKAAVAREGFAPRETPSGAPSASPAAVTPPPGVSAPIVLPVTQPARNATASTIPIAVGPQVDAKSLPRRQPGPPRPASRPPAQRFSQQPKGRPPWQRPGVIVAVVVVVLLIVWLVFIRR